MFLDFKSYRSSAPAYILLLLIMIVGRQNVFAQNVISPYSILGIGDIENRDFGRYAVSGSAAISRRNDAIYNYANPASLTALSLKIVSFDFVGRAKISTFRSADTLSAANKDFAVDRVSMAFRSSPRIGFAFGLKPYSNVNYKYSLSNAVYSNEVLGYSKNIEGSGGINQVYGSLGYALSKNFSAGITASYLFGTTQKSTTYLDETLELEIVNKQYSFYTGANILGGLQYYTSPQRQWQHTIGLTASGGTALKGYSKTEYTEADTTFLEKSNGTAIFKMPVSAGLGYTASNKQGLSMSLEGVYYHWPRQKINYTNSYTSPSVKLSAGWEYSKQTKYYLTNVSYEKYYLGMGLTAQNSYYLLNGNKLWDYSLTLGGGYNLTGNLYMHAGLEFGRKGNNKSGQIQEHYSQVTIGFTVRDMWFRASSDRRD